MKNTGSSDFLEDDLPEAELLAFNKIIHNIYRRRGVDFRQYRTKCLRRRIVVGMHDSRVNSFEEYLDFLIKNPEGYDNLLDRITINVTEFFRNPETFNAVRRKIIPEIVKAKKEINASSIRVWSSGCATGEEPYSLAIMISEVLSELKENFKIRIYATDIDKAALKQAEAGVYKEKALKELKGHQISAYFQKNEQGLYAINPNLKTMINFRHHNMSSDEPLQRIDLIFCRNVIIYFTKELQKQVYANFYKALAPLGYLVAGKTESLMDINESHFAIFDLQERILKKK
ncbi:MAG: protein-glutamate O-methyltransferase CheR [Candidatus Omnitrophica bacterium]|nr:protein-glutamate O-methyltransferase CheR [Candidatus Omnitrophota bacterium]